MSDEAELVTVMDCLRSGHDMLPFLAGLYSAGQVKLQPMPADMQALLEDALDYRSPDPGEGLVWLQIASADDAAELVVYRTGSLADTPGKASLSRHALSVTSRR